VISFDTNMRVEHPIEDVFAFVSNPTQFPLWNSAVQAVHRTSGETGEPGSTYSMERELPTGQVETRSRSSPASIPANSGFAQHRGRRLSPIGTDSPPTAPTPSSTSTPPSNCPRVAAVLGPLAARGVKRGVDANHAALKRTLEGGGAGA
jgi:hypothetical protein